MNCYDAASQAFLHALWAACYCSYCPLPPARPHARPTARPTDVHYLFPRFLPPARRSKVLAEINEATAPVALQAVRALAKYLTQPEAKAAVLAQLEAWLNDATASTSPAVQAVSATIYIHEGQPHLALRAVRAFATLEALALSIQIYLRIDRIDLAERQLRLLQERDDESALYQLSAAHVFLVLGGDKYRDALSTYQEMLQRYGEDSVAVTNGLCAALVCLRRYDEAERLLKEAFAKEPNSPETLINYLAVLQHTGRGLGSGAAAAEPASAMLLATLQRVAPGHPFVGSIALAESSFDRVSAGFSA